MSLMTVDPVRDGWKLQRMSRHRWSIGVACLGDEWSARAEIGVFQASIRGSDVVYFSRTGMFGRWGIEREFML
jgi:hypothetical protein